jgi:hypothetical protein
MEEELGGNLYNCGSNGIISNRQTGGSQPWNNNGFQNSDNPYNKGFGGYSGAFGQRSE